MSDWTRDSQGTLWLDDTRGHFTVRRHGEGRKYWGVTYPDGTYTHNALTASAAKAQAQSWRPDPSLVSLSDNLDGEFIDGGDSSHGAEYLNVSSSRSGPVPAPSAVGTGYPPLTPAGAVSAIIDGAPAVKIATAAYSYNDTGASQQKALSAVVALAELRAEVEASIAQQIALARANTSHQWGSNSATWEQVGKALGVTKQSAQSRYGKTS